MTSGCIRSNTTPFEGISATIILQLVTLSNRQASPSAQQPPNVVSSQQTGATVPSQPLLSVNRTSVVSPQLTLHRNAQGPSLPASAPLVQQQSFFPTFHRSQSRELVQTKVGSRDHCVTLLWLRQAYREPSAIHS